MSGEYIDANVDLLLGQEFLTWLWYRSETANGQFRLSPEAANSGQPFSVSMEQRIVVRGGEGEHRETATVSGSLSPLREARLGLQTGKQVVRALLRLQKDELEWLVTLKAEDFSLGSFKTPAIAKDGLGEEDPDARFLEKIYLLENGLALLDDIYRQFLQVRFDEEKWRMETNRVAAWMQHDISQGAM